MKANFKQATVRSGNAILQFEVSTSADGILDALKLTGEQVELSIVQTEPFIDTYTGEVTYDGGYDG